MYNKDNVVIYVGKAKNLKNRVSQYFLKPQSGKVFAMVMNVDHFETILVQNESEAFLLEYNLIHKCSPKYNILLKDDKHYPYIALKSKGIPEIKLARNIKNKNYIYFGPYPRSSYASQVIKLVNQIYPLKKCNILPKKACIYFQLGQCKGYCVNKIDEEDNERLFIEVKSFLEGKTKEKENELKNKIKNFSNVLDFENAQKYKFILDSIENLKVNQVIEFNKNENFDAFSYIVKDNLICINLFIYRNGALIGKESFIEEIFGSEIDVITNIIFQYYEQNIKPVKIIVFSKELKDELSKLYDNVLIKKDGKYSQILNTMIKNMNKNIEDYYKKLNSKKDKINLLNELKELLKIDYFPTLIELFDNSHINGCDAVSVSVAYLNGEPCKKLYRKFKLTNENTKSDVDNMKEVLTRKFKRYEDANSNIPNLIFMDGGIQQVHVAYEILNKYDLNIDIYGLFKNDKHQTNGIIDKNGHIYELDHNSSLFKILTQMQDEVHRFAITYFENRHLNNYKKSIFDDIKGLGRAKTQLIYNTYKTYDDLLNASLNELEQLLNKEIAEELYKKLHKSI